MRDYTAEELASPGTGHPLKYVFADHANRAILRACGGEGDSTWRGVEKVSEESFLEAMMRLPFVRFEKGPLSFRVYPTKVEDLQVNEILWRAAHESVYAAEEGNETLHLNLFCLGYPSQLFHFLVSLSLEKIHLYMIHLLALHYTLLRQDEDVVGMEKMRVELLPPVWREVERKLMEFGTLSSAGTKSDYDTVLGSVPFIYLLPWKVDVYCGYWSREDMRAALSEHLEGEDDQMVPAISRDGEISPGENWSSVHWNLFRDWLVYSELLFKRSDASWVETLVSMDRLISEGRQRDVFERAKTLMLCAKREESDISCLPTDLIQSKLLPLVTRDSPGAPSASRILPEEVPQLDD